MDERLGRLETEVRDIRQKVADSQTALWTAIHELRNWQAGAAAREEARIESMRRLDMQLSAMRIETRDQIREMRSVSEATLKDIRENMVTRDQNRPVAAVVYAGTATLGAAIFGAIWKFFINPSGG